MKLKLLKLLNIKKSIAVATTVCFLFTMVFSQGAYAFITPAPLPVVNQNTLKSIENYLLPFNIGRITDALYTGGDEIVINIQDLHSHAQAQRNISSILSALDQQYGLENVYVEGGIGQVDTSWLSSISNKELREKILNNMLESGRLTGGEYYSVETNKNKLLMGIEDKDTYINNLKRLNEFYSKKQEILQYVSFLKYTLNEVSKKYYTRDNLKLNRVISKYKKGNLTAQKYFTYLLKAAQKANINLRKYPNIIAFLQVLKKQEGLDTKKVNLAIAELLNELKAKLSYEQYQSLISKVSNKSKETEFYFDLYKVAKEKGLLEKSDYRTLLIFFEYLSLNQSLNPVSLTLDEKNLLQELNIRLSKTQNEKNIYFLQNYLEYFSGYLTNKLTASDYEYFINNMSNFRLLWKKYVDINDIIELDSYFNFFSDFYKDNVERNRYFIKNIMGKMPDNPKEGLRIKSNIAHAQTVLDQLSKTKKVKVVITGGFHTYGFTKLLQDNNINYIVITPNVTKQTVSADALYENIFKEQASALYNTLQKMLASQTGEDGVLNSDVIKALNSSRLNNEAVNVLNELLKSKKINEKVINVQFNENEVIVTLNDGSKKIISLNEELTSQQESSVSNYEKDFNVFNKIANHAQRIRELNREEEKNYEAIRKEANELIYDIENIDENSPLKEYAEQFEFIEDLLNTDGNIVAIGPSGSGKSTAINLVNELTGNKFAVISIDDLIADTDNNLDKSMKNTSEIIDVLEEELSKPEYKGKQIIFDGFGRTAGQVKKLKEILGDDTSFVFVERYWKTKKDKKKSIEDGIKKQEDDGKGGHATTDADLEYKHWYTNGNRADVLNELGLEDGKTKSGNSRLIIKDELIPSTLIAAVGDITFDDNKMIDAGYLTQEQVDKLRGDVKLVNKFLDNPNSLSSDEEKYFNKEIAKAQNVVKFGTAGHRELIVNDDGEETFNPFVVFVLTDAYAEYINKNDKLPKRMFVGYDTRYMGKEYANITAKTFAKYGIEVDMPNKYLSTPAISNQVKNSEKEYAGSVNITASHNPGNYNGYKVNGPLGNPYSSSVTNQISNLAKDTSRFKMYKIKSRMAQSEQKDFKPASVDEYRKSHVNNVLKIIRNMLGKEDISLIEGTNILFDSNHSALELEIRNIFNELTRGVKNTVYKVLNSGRTGRDVVFGKEGEDKGKSPEPNENNSQQLKAELQTNVNEELKAGKKSIKEIELTNFAVTTDPDGDRFGMYYVKYNEQDEVFEVKFATPDEIGAVVQYILLENLKERLENADYLNKDNYKEWLKDNGFPIGLVKSADTTDQFNNLAEVYKQKFTDIISKTTGVSENEIKKYIKIEIETVDIGYKNLADAAKAMVERGTTPVILLESSGGLVAGLSDEHKTGTYDKDGLVANILPIVLLQNMDLTFATALNEIEKSTGKKESLGRTKVSKETEGLRALSNKIEVELSDKNEKGQSEGTYNNYNNQIKEKEIPADDDADVVDSALMTIGNIIINKSANGDYKTIKLSGEPIKLEKIVSVKDLSEEDFKNLQEEGVISKEVNYKDVESKIKELLQKEIFINPDTSIANGFEIRFYNKKGYSLIVRASGTEPAIRIYTKTLTSGNEIRQEEEIVKDIKEYVKENDISLQTLLKNDRSYLTNEIELSENDTMVLDNSTTNLDPKLIKLLDEYWKATGKDSKLEEDLNAREQILNTLLSKDNKDIQNVFDIASEINNGNYKKVVILTDDEYSSKSALETMYTQISKDAPEIEFLAATKENLSELRKDNDTYVVYQGSDKNFTDSNKVNKSISIDDNIKQDYIYPLLPIVVSCKDNSKNVVREFLEGERKILDNKDVIKQAVMVNELNYILGIDTCEVLPYSSHANSFVQFVQNMFSGFIKVFGQPGTDGQHSFYQSSHQGTFIVYSIFVGFANSSNRVMLASKFRESHLNLLSNLLAQAYGFAVGRNKAEVKKQEPKLAEDLVPHKVFKGNRPSTVLLFSNPNAVAAGASHSLFSIVGKYSKTIKEDKYLQNLRNDLNEEKSSDVKKNFYDTRIASLKERIKNTKNKEEKIKLNKELKDLENKENEIESINKDINKEKATALKESATINKKINVSENSNINFKTNLSKTIIEAFAKLFFALGLNEKLLDIIGRTNANGDIVLDNKANFTENRYVTHYSRGSFIEFKNGEAILKKGKDGKTNKKFLVKIDSEFNEETYGQRYNRDGSTNPNGEYIDIAPKEVEVVNKMIALRNKCESNGIKHYISFGIGGSDLGPRKFTEILEKYKKGDKNSHFVHNVDPEDFIAAIEEYNEICPEGEEITPKNTLFIIESKSFTTAETMTNAKLAKDWFNANKKKGTTVGDHFVAVSTNKKDVGEFGIDTENNMFPFQSSIGGRFSVMSPVGLPLMLSIGEEDYIDMLNGQASIYDSVREAVESGDYIKLAQNSAFITAVVNIFNINILHKPHQIIKSAIKGFVDYFQQLYMECNGKSVDRNGNAITTYDTGNNVMEDDNENPEGIISIGKSENKFEKDTATAVFELNELSPSNLGALTALHEFKTIITGLFWNINSFDQWGVELGKKLAITNFDIFKKAVKEGISAITSSDGIHKTTKNLMSFIFGEQENGTKDSKLNLGFGRFPAITESPIFFIASFFPMFRGTLAKMHKYNWSNYTIGDIFSAFLSGNINAPQKLNIGNSNEINRGVNVVGNLTVLSAIVVVLISVAPMLFGAGDVAAHNLINYGILEPSFSLINTIFNAFIGSYVVNIIAHKVWNILHPNAQLNLFGNLSGLMIEMEPYAHNTVKNGAFYTREQIIEDKKNSVKSEMDTLISSKQYKKYIETYIKLLILNNFRYDNNDNVLMTKELEDLDKKLTLARSINIYDERMLDLIEEIENIGTGGINEKYTQELKNIKEYIKQNKSKQEEKAIFINLLKEPINEKNWWDDVDYSDEGRVAFGRLKSSLFLSDDVEILCDKLGISAEDIYNNLPENIQREILQIFKKVSDKTIIEDPVDYKETVVAESMNIYTAQKMLQEYNKEILDTLRKFVAEKEDNAKDEININRNNDKPFYVFSNKEIFELSNAIERAGIKSELYKQIDEQIEDKNNEIKEKNIEIKEKYNAINQINTRNGLKREIIKLKDEIKVLEQLKKSVKNANSIKQLEDIAKNTNLEFPIKKEKELNKLKEKEERYNLLIETVEIYNTPEELSIKDFAIQMESEYNKRMMLAIQIKLIEGKQLTSEEIKFLNDLKDKPYWVIKRYFVKINETIRTKMVERDNIIQKWGENNGRAFEAWWPIQRAETVQGYILEFIDIANKVSNYNDILSLKQKLEEITSYNFFDASGIKDKKAFEKTLNEIIDLKISQIVEDKGEHNRIFLEYIVENFDKLDKDTVNLIEEFAAIIPKINDMYDDALKKENDLEEITILLEKGNGIYDYRDEIGVLNYKYEQIIDKLLANENVSSEIKEYIKEVYGLIGNVEETDFISLNRIIKVYNDYIEKGANDNAANIAFNNMYSSVKARYRRISKKLEDNNLKNVQNEFKNVFKQDDIDTFVKNSKLYKLTENDLYDIKKGIDSEIKKYEEAKEKYEKSDKNDKDQKEFKAAQEELNETLNDAADEVFDRLETYKKELDKSLPKLESLNTKINSDSSLRLTKDSTKDNRIVKWFDKEIKEREDEKGLKRVYKWGLMIAREVLVSVLELPEAINIIFNPEKFLVKHNSYKMAVYKLAFSGTNGKRLKSYEGNDYEKVTNVIADVQNEIGKLLTKEKFNDNDEKELQRLEKDLKELKLLKKVLETFVDNKNNFDEQGTEFKEFKKDFEKEYGTENEADAVAKAINIKSAMDRGVDIVGFGSFIVFIIGTVLSCIIIGSDNGSLYSLLMPVINGTVVSLFSMLGLHTGWNIKNPFAKLTKDKSTQGGLLGVPLEPSVEKIYVIADLLLEDLPGIVDFLKAKGYMDENININEASQEFQDAYHKAFETFLNENGYKEDDGYEKLVDLFFSDSELSMKLAMDYHNDAYFSAQEPKVNSGTDFENIDTRLLNKNYLAEDKFILNEKGEVIPYNQYLIEQLRKRNIGSEDEYKDPKKLAELRANTLLSVFDLETQERLTDRSNPDLRNKIFLKNFKSAKAFKNLNLSLNSNDYYEAKEYETFMKDLNLFYSVAGKNGVDAVQKDGSKIAKIAEIKKDEQYDIKTESVGNLIAGLFRKGLDTQIGNTMVVSGEYVDSIAGEYDNPDAFRDIFIGLQKDGMLSVFVVLFDVLDNPSKYYLRDENGYILYDNEGNPRINVMLILLAIHSAWASNNSWDGNLAHIPFPEDLCKNYDGKLSIDETAKDGEQLKVLYAITTTGNIMEGALAKLNGIVGLSDENKKIVDGIMNEWENLSEALNKEQFDSPIVKEQNLKYYKSLKEYENLKAEISALSNKDNKEKLTFINTKMEDFADNILMSEFLLFKKTEVLVDIYYNSESYVEKESARRQLVQIRDTFGNINDSTSLREIYVNNIKDIGNINIEKLDRATDIQEKIFGKQKEAVDKISKILQNEVYKFYADYEKYNNNEYKYFIKNVAVPAYISTVIQGKIGYLNKTTPIRNKKVEKYYEEITKKNYKEESIEELTAMLEIVDRGISYVEQDQLGIKKGKLEKARTKIERTLLQKISSSSIEELTTALEFIDTEIAYFSKQQGLDPEAEETLEYLKQVRTKIRQEIETKTFRQILIDEVSDDNLIERIKDAESIEGTQNQEGLKDIFFEIAKTDYETATQIYSRLNNVKNSVTNINKEDLKGKPVMLVLDLNAPYDKDELKINDPKRIVAAADAIEYLVRAGAKIMITSHHGRPKGNFLSSESLVLATRGIEQELKKRGIAMNIPIAYPAQFKNKLSDVIKDYDIAISGKTYGDYLSNLDVAVNGDNDGKKQIEMKNGNILVVENNRFSKDENKDNDMNKLIEIFKPEEEPIHVMSDNFGSMHRTYLFNKKEEGKDIISFVGPLANKELSVLSKLDNIPHPFGLVLGGSKVSDKIGVIYALLDKMNSEDALIVGGKMAYSFMDAQAMIDKYGMKKTEKNNLKEINKVKKELEEAKDDKQKEEKLKKKLEELNEIKDAINILDKVEKMGENAPIFEFGYEKDEDHLAVETITDEKGNVISGIDFDKGKVVGNPKVKILKGNEEVPANYIRIDIGPESIKRRVKIIEQIGADGGTIFTNGPQGGFDIATEEEDCDIDLKNGTFALLYAMEDAAKAGGFVIIGGGDSVFASNMAEIEETDNFYKATGGGASMKRIADGTLKALGSIPSVFDDILKEVEPILEETKATKATEEQSSDTVSEKTVFYNKSVISNKGVISLANLKQLLSNLRKHNPNLVVVQETDTDVVKPEGKDKNTYEGVLANSGLRNSTDAIVDKNGELTNVFAISDIPAAIEYSAQNSMNEMVLIWDNILVNGKQGNTLSAKEDLNNWKAQVSEYVEKYGPEIRAKAKEKGITLSAHAMTYERKMEDIGFYPNPKIEEWKDMFEFQIEMAEKLGITSMVVHAINDYDSVDDWVDLINFASQKGITLNFENDMKYLAPQANLYDNSLVNGFIDAEDYIAFLDAIRNKLSNKNKKYMGVCIDTSRVFSAVSSNQSLSIEERQSKITFESLLDYIEKVTEAGYQINVLHLAQFDKSLKEARALESFEQQPIVTETKTTNSFNVATEPIQIIESANKWLQMKVLKIISLFKEKPEIVAVVDVNDTKAIREAKQLAKQGIKVKLAFVGDYDDVRKVIKAEFSEKTEFINESDIKSEDKDGNLYNEIYKKVGNLEIVFDEAVSKGIVGNQLETTLDKMGNYISDKKVLYVSKSINVNDDDCKAAGILTYDSTSISTAIAKGLITYNDEIKEKFKDSFVAPSSIIASYNVEDIDNISNEEIINLREQQGISRIMLKVTNETIEEAEQKKAKFENNGITDVMIVIVDEEGKYKIKGDDTEVVSYTDALSNKNLQSSIVYVGVNDRDNIILNAKDMEELIATDGISLAFDADVLNAMDSESTKDKGLSMLGIIKSMFANNSPEANRNKGIVKGRNAVIKNEIDNIKVEDFIKDGKADITDEQLKKLGIEAKTTEEREGIALGIIQALELTKVYKTKGLSVKNIRSDTSNELLTMLGEYRLLNENNPKLKGIEKSYAGKDEKEIEEIKGNYEDILSDLRNKIKSGNKDAATLEQIIKILLTDQIELETEIEELTDIDIRVTQALLAAA